MNMYLVVNRPEMDQKLFCIEVVIRYQKLWITNTKIPMNKTSHRLALYEINILEERIIHLLIVEYYHFKQ